MYSEEKRKVKIKYMILTALILFLPMKVKATTVEYNFVNTTLNTTGSSVSVQTFDNGSLRGEYTAEFTAAVFSDTFIKSIEANTVNHEWTCNVGTIPLDFQRQSGTSRYAYLLSVSCKLDHESAITNFRFNFTGNPNVATDIFLSNQFTLYNTPNGSGGNSIDYTSQIQSVINNLNNNNTWNNYIFNQLDNNFPTIISILNQLHTDLSSSNGTIVTAINNNWNDFNNADISQQDQTPPDTTTIDTVQAEETQQISDIQTAIQNIQAPTFDLTDFRNTFAWIWQTIIYLFTTHTILMSTMTIVLSLGFVKTIFGR